MKLTSEQNGKKHHYLSSIGDEQEDRELCIHGYKYMRFVTSLGSDLRNPYPSISSHISSDFSLWGFLCLTMTGYALLLKLYCVGTSSALISGDAVTSC